VTCLVDRFYPGVGHATVNALERAGVEIHVPADQTCCGQPAFNGGFVDEARAMARQTIDVLTASQDPVVVPSGSCADMIVNHYPELFIDDAVYGPKARELASRTYELSQFLVDVLGTTDPGSRTSARLAYHASCHGLRGLGLRDAPRQLLGAATGGHCADLPDAETCCGFGGLFAIKMAPVSDAMLQSKIASIESSGADAVVATACRRADCAARRRIVFEPVEGVPRAGLARRLDGRSGDRECQRGQHVEGLGRPGSDRGRLRGYGRSGR
jgi:L-lactate dehydrogenase complex protein LldE